MSRKWERMVERNQKSVNQLRKKQGQIAVRSAPRESVTIIKGRSWMLPSFLVMFAIMYFIVSYSALKHEFSYWFTGFSYIGLGLLVYWIRRPVIKIGKDYLTVRRFAGDKFLDAKDIQELVLHKDHVVIVMKEKKKQYLFTRLQHRFPMDLLQAKLHEFAKKHQIPTKD